MINFFKKIFTKKEKQPQIRIPLEEQIETFKKIGFSLKEGLSIDFLLSELDRKDYELSPYNTLFFSLAGEYEKGDGIWEYISDNIYHFDAECIEDCGAYVTILNNLKRISNGSFDIQNVTDKIEIEPEKASVSFMYKGKKYEWDLIVDNDWFDETLISRINKLMKSTGENKQFYQNSPDQTTFLICVDEEIKEKIEELIGEEFY